MPLLVKHLMNRDVVKVRADATVDELDRVLAEHDVSGVPVIGEDGKVVGIASQTDIVRLISKKLVYSGGFYDSVQNYLRAVNHLTRELRVKKVSAIMQRRIHSVWPDDDVSRAAAVMGRLGIHRVLVLDEGRASGILTSLDLIKVIEDLGYYDEYYGLTRARKGTVRQD